MNDMKEKLTNSAGIIKDAVEEIKQCKDEPSLKRVHKKYLGRGGVITKELMRIPTFAKNIQRSKSKMVLQLQQSFLKAYNGKKGELLNDRGSDK